MIDKTRCFGDCDTCSFGHNCSCLYDEDYDDDCAYYDCESDDCDNCDLKD